MRRTNSVATIFFALFFGAWLAASCTSGGAGPVDTDRDGTPDVDDAFPDDASEHEDSDGDGVGDNADAFPKDPTQSLDTDGDGLGNAIDPDPDGDGLFGADDPDPLDITVPVPDAVPPPDDYYGGVIGEPFPAFTAEDTQVHRAGRTIFERRFTLPEGLGPIRFGTGCAECHFDPVTGGTSPVRRRAFFFNVLTGTEAELTRQVQPLFGVGLFELVSDEEILSRRDDLDADGDGISGRPNSDGPRVGRYGRKAQAGTIESIVRGELINQMGITTDPVIDGMSSSVPVEKDFWDKLNHVLLEFSFASPVYAQARPPQPTEDGNSLDGDNAPDPELDEPTVRNLIAYVSSLAPPIRATITESEVRGAQVFANIGCAVCHTPMLLTMDGTPIYPYSDLLLHDMGDGMADGLTLGVATTREFRTQPLWGLRSRTFSCTTVVRPPWKTPSVFTEAKPPRRASFDALSDEDYNALLDFLYSL